MQLQLGYSRLSKSLTLNSRNLVLSVWSWFNGRQFNPIPLRLNPTWEADLGCLPNLDPTGRVHLGSEYVYSVYESIHEMVLKDLS